VADGADGLGEVGLPPLRWVCVRRVLVHDEDVLQTNSIMGIFRP
jgi:hypothetical protein